MVTLHKILSDKHQMFQFVLEFLSGDTIENLTNTNKETYVDCLKLLAKISIAGSISYEEDFVINLEEVNSFYDKHKNVIKSWVKKDYKTFSNLINSNYIGFWISRPYSNVKKLIVYAIIEDVARVIMEEIRWSNIEDVARVIMEEIRRSKLSLLRL